MWTALPIQGWRRRRNARAVGACCISSTRTRGQIRNGVPARACQRESWHLQAAGRSRARGVSSIHGMAPIEAPVLTRLGEVRGRDLALARQIRDRARDSQDTGVRARGETEPVALGL